jgi:hypothetical protein
MADHLPPWYLKGIRDEIARLRALVKGLEEEVGSPEKDQGQQNLIPLTIERHGRAIKELQHIWDENDAEKS